MWTSCGIALCGITSPPHEPQEPHESQELQLSQLLQEACLLPNQPRIRLNTPFVSQDEQEEQDESQLQPEPQLPWQLDSVQLSQEACLWK